MRTYIRTAGVPYPANLESVRGEALKTLAAQVQELAQTVAANAESEAIERRRREVQAAAAKALARAEQLRQNRIADIRAQLTAAWVRHDDLSDADTEAKYAKLAADARQRKQARELFTRAECPGLQTDHLAIVEMDKNARWKNVRQILSDRLSRGYLVALLGIRGTGKTQISVCVIQAACAIGMSARYVKAKNLFDAVFGAYTQVAKGVAGERADVIQDQFVAYDLLVVDELHQNAMSPAKFDTLINILDRRYDAKRPTILIANLDKPQFAAYVGDSIVSRIHETGAVIECDWESYRREGQWLQ